LKLPIARQFLFLCERVMLIIKNVEAAAELGMRAVMFTGAENCARRVKEIIQDF